MSVYQECPQQFAYEEVLKLKAKRTASNLSLGTLVHLALAYKYLHEPDPLAKVEEYATKNDLLGLMDQVKDLYYAHNKRWDKEDFDVLDVEREFRIEIGGEPYTQRVDLVARINDAVVFVDHKTYGNPKYKQNWELKGQFIGLMVLGQMLSQDIYGLPFGGVWVNEICTMKPVAPRSFSRKKVHVPAGLTDAFVHNIKRSYAEIDRLKELNPWSYPKNFSACEGKYGRGCSYWQLCTLGPSVIGEFDKAE